MNDDIFPENPESQQPSNGLDIDRPKHVPGVINESPEEDLLDGVVLAGSVAMHEIIKQGAATLSF